MELSGRAFGKEINAQHGCVTKWTLAINLGAQHAGREGGGGTPLGLQCRSR